MKADPGRFSIVPLSKKKKRTLKGLRIVTANAKVILNKHFLSEIDMLELILDQLEPSLSNIMCC